MAAAPLSTRGEFDCQLARIWAGYRHNQAKIQIPLGVKYNFER